MFLLRLSATRFGIVPLCSHQAEYTLIGRLINTRHNNLTIIIMRHCYFGGFYSVAGVAHIGLENIV